MKNKLKMTFIHLDGGWKYNGLLIYDIQDEDGSPLPRVAVWIGDIDGEYGNLKIVMVTLKVDGPMPDGIGIFKYLNIFDTLEKQEVLVRLGPETLDTSVDYLDVPIDYVIPYEPEFYKLSSAPEDPKCVEEVAKWLEDFLEKDGILNKFKSMLKSVRNESASTNDKKIVPDSREKSTGGDEDDIT